MNELFEGEETVYLEIEYLINIQVITVMILIKMFPSNGAFLI